MPPEIGVEAGVPQREIRLRELTQPDLDEIIDVTGAMVASKSPSLKYVSLIHLGRVISIDSRNWRSRSRKGPFLSVSSDGATQQEIPPLLNPLGTITSESVTFTEQSIDRDGNTVSRHVEIFRGGLILGSSVLAKKD